QAFVVDGATLELAALAAKLKLDALAVDARVAIAQRGEAEGVVLLGVTRVADAKASAFEQLHDGREHLAAWHARKRDIAADVAANTGQRAREIAQALELVRVADLAPFWMVPVLLAPARVATGGLEMSPLVCTDPDVAPCG